MDIIPETAYKSLDDQQSVNGWHQGKEIRINQRLLDSDEPYLATETLLHEARHDYQEHVAQQRPDLAENSLQLEDFQKNSGAGYTLADQDPVQYLWQPVEKDAREVARQRTDDLYAKQFADTNRYHEHRQTMEADEAAYKRMGRDELGENYEAIARQTAFAQYEVAQSQQQASASEPHLSNPTESTEGKEETSEEEYEYSQGYNL